VLPLPKLAVPSPTQPFAKLPLPETTTNCDTTCVQVVAFPEMPLPAIVTVSVGE
jgi:hypothetical protein